MKSMARTRTIRWALLVFGMSACVAAQDSSQSQPATPPAPAFGQNAPVLSPENPPVTSLDEPTLELRTASRSFISPALQVSESADTNGANRLGSNDVQSVSHVLGAFDLQQFWPKSDLFLEYLGGGAFYTRPYGVQQMQAAGLEAVTRWRTGQVTLRDSFSYLPDGSFQSGYGGNPGLGLVRFSTGGGLPGFGNTALGAVGNIPRLANTAILDVVQAINPRSAFTVAGAFTNSHFYDPSSPPTFLNGDQITVQGGYSHLFSRHDQLGVVYGFQLFQFPQVSGGEVYNHVLNVRWSHTITGRLSFIIGAGPQYTDLQRGGELKHWSVTGRAQLRYKFAHSYLIAAYERFTSPGSGFFAGTETQAARLGYTRPLGRTWTVYADAGYSHNKKLQDALFGAQTASSYDEGSAGAVLRKHLGRSYDFFGVYRFTDVAFNSSPGLPGIPGTGRIAHRHVGSIGVEWHPRPTRIE
jgi:hypothetical protein